MARRCPGVWRVQDYVPARDYPTTIILYMKPTDSLPHRLYPHPLLGLRIAEPGARSYPAHSIGRHVARCDGPHLT